MTKEQFKKTILLILDVIKDLKEIPSGHLYAHLMSKVSLEEYNSMLDLLKDKKFIKVKSHLITYIGGV